MTQQQKEYIIDEELAELIEGQLTNKWCKRCPYEGGGINSGIKAHLRSRPQQAGDHGVVPDYVTTQKEIRENTSRIEFLQGVNHE
jgi:hypothetical protein